jgi:hypothetical protein
VRTSTRGFCCGARRRRPVGSRRPGLLASGICRPPIRPATVVPPRLTGPSSAVAQTGALATDHPERLQARKESRSDPARNRRLLLGPRAHRPGSSPGAPHVSRRRARSGCRAHGALALRPRSARDRLGPGPQAVATPVRRSLRRLATRTGHTTFGHLPDPARAGCAAPPLAECRRGAIRSRAGSDEIPVRRA